MLQMTVVPVPVKWVAAMVLPSANTPPTDRSMPAVRMTMPCPRPSAASDSVSAARVPRDPPDSVPGCLIA